MNRGKRKFEVPKEEGAEVKKRNRGSLDNSMDLPVPAIPMAGYPEVEKVKGEEVARLKEIFPDISINYLKVQAPNIQTTMCKLLSAVILILLIVLGKVVNGNGF